MVFYTVKNTVKTQIDSPVTTNTNGIAICDYVGSGMGDIAIMAETEIEGMIVSTPYEVCDATFYDKGLSGTGNHNDNWTYARMSAERTSDGTILTSSGAWAYCYVISGSTYFNPSFCIEFDVVSYTDSPSIRFGKGGTSIAYGISETGHYKIEWKTDEINVIVNGTPKSHSLSSLVGENVFIYFEHSATTDVLKYANFRIYPI